MGTEKASSSYDRAAATTDPPQRPRSLWVRWAVPVRWALLVLVLVALVVLGRVWLDDTLTSEALVQWVQRWVDSWGPWGPLAFALVYVLATLLFIPGSVLGLAAGAIFGPLLGTLIVSFASTASAALAFLIARYVAREAVRHRVEQSAKLRAVDEAIGEQGWRIVALLRLSPALPFSLQNYVYGITAIGFWPCVLISWPAMLPGTFLYVYLGSLGRTAAAGETSTAHWAARGVGLVATVAVTLLLAKLARDAITSETQIEETEQPEIESQTKRK